MGTYNIYGYTSGEDDGLALVTIALDETTTEIVDITSDEPDTKAEAEHVLRDYMDAGFTAPEAISRYAGSYGTVREVGPDGEVIPNARSHGLV